MVMIILTVGIVEFGRVMMVRNQLQNAGDAAALAAAGGDENVTKWVKVVVTTDRGRQTVCDDESCWCTGCGSVSINVTGLESELLDDGQWQDFCVPPCDCGGDECTIQIADRWVTMQSATNITGGRQDDITEAIGNMLESSRIALSYRAYRDQAKVYEVLKSARTLGDLNTLASSHANWINKYTGLHCQQYWDEMNPETYNSCVSIGHNDWQQMQAGLPNLERMIKAQRRLEQLQSISTTAGVSKEYIGEVVNDYLAANISGARVDSVEVYDQRGSPFYPSVVVYAAKEVPVVMRDFISIPLMLDPSSEYLFGDDSNIATVETCSQGDTHYIDPRLTQYSQYGELIADPEDRYYVEKPGNACR